MSKLIPINLEEVVPPNGTFAMLTYKAPANAKALLHLHENDKTPMELVGPGGELEVSVAAGRTLYLQPQDSSNWEIGCTGFRF